MQIALLPTEHPRVPGWSVWSYSRPANDVGGDLVEVSPAYDTSGNTALTAANLLFEMLCVFPGVQYRT